MLEPATPSQGGANAAPLFIRNVKPVKAVQWFKHGDHPSVKRLGSVHDPRLDGDEREIGVCHTHYGEKFVLAGDWILTDHRAFIFDVLKDWEFRRDYVPVCQGEPA